jgi:hypothetical protein
MSVVFRGASPRRPPLHVAWMAGTPAPRQAHFAPLVRALRIWVTTAATVVIGGSSTVFACPVCFGAEETPMIDGAKLGILVMLAITFAVQGGFVAFFLYLRRRAKRMAEIDLDNEWSELQGASRT